MTTFFKCKGNGQRGLSLLEIKRKLNIRERNIGNEYEGEKYTFNFRDIILKIFFNRIRISNKQQFDVQIAFDTKLSELLNGIFSCLSVNFIC